MALFFLESDESFDQLCCKIMRTTKGRISFNCALCQDEAYCDFESYQTHFNAVHLDTDNEVKVDKTDSKDEVLNMMQGLENFLDVELLDFDKNLEKLTLVTEKKFSNHSETEKTNICQSKTKKLGKKLVDRFQSHTPVRKKSVGLQIPAEFRQVAKRVKYKGDSIADEKRIHKCPVCNMGFKDRCSMIHHIKRHGNEKNYACSECKKEFFTSTELNLHVARVHTGERSHLCYECGRTFFSIGALGAHIKRHRDQRDYTCPNCPKAFFSSNLLNEHMRSHSSERPFSCNLCDADFKRSKALKNHLKLHENKREYKCELCEMGFNQKAGLHSHMKSTHKMLYASTNYVRCNTNKNEEHINN